MLWEGTALQSSRIEKLLLILMGVVITLMMMNIGLFLRMNQLQSQVIQSLAPIQGAFNPPEGLVAGVQAPPFHLTDTEGQSVSRTGYDGESLLLVFSSTTCPACQDKYSMLKAFNERHPNFAFLMISEGSVEANQAMVQEQGFEFPVLNWQDEVAEAYQVPGTPHFYLIEDGIVTYSGFIASVDEMERISGFRE